MDLIWQRLPATVELTLAAMLLSIVVGLPLGLYAGLYPESSISRVIMAGSIFGFSLPSFWGGLMLIMVFAVMLGWLPSTGRGAPISWGKSRPSYGSPGFPARENRPSPISLRKSWRA
ncbi:MAG: ABC transporter permease, partial [Sphingomonadaceae bacterium]